MKKIKWIVGFLVIIGGIAAWFLFAPATTFSEKNVYLYVRTGENVQQALQKQIEEKRPIKTIWLFNSVAGKLNVWSRIKPGRFEIKKGSSISDVVRMLRNNTQSPVRLTINTLRLNEDLAKLIGKNFAGDSASAAAFLLNNDSLIAFGADTNTLKTFIIPNTYFFNWNAGAQTIMKKLKEESERFWQKNNRIEKAAAAGLTPQQVYIIASITEQETNIQEDKGKIASVYINRLNKGMLLGADPTVKYAMKDFGLKRILYGHLKTESPYNTYKYKGLPPGPICTPSISTIDAVLDAPKTDYLFFVAESSLNGYSHFSNSYEEHEKYAKAYQQALNEMMKNKK